LGIYLRQIMQKKIRVGAVSYLNTKPLIYGFEKGKMSEQIELTLDYPARLAALMQKDQLDIALLPIVSILNLPEASMFSAYCIASNKKVASVCLYSHVPIEEVQEVYLDYQSRTSVALFRILIRDYWNIRPSLLESDEHYIEQIKGKTAGLIIGDRALEQRENFPFVYDLAEAWQSHTQFPFVFATWVTNKELSPAFIHEFNETNAFGLSHLDEIIGMQSFPYYDLNTYFTENISYKFDEEKSNGMQLFLKMAEKL